MYCFNTINLYLLQKKKVILMFSLWIRKKYKLVNNSIYFGLICKDDYLYQEYQLEFFCLFALSFVQFFIKNHHKQRLLSSSSQLKDKGKLCWNISHIFCWGSLSTKLKQVVNKSWRYPCLYDELFCAFQN